MKMLNDEELQLYLLGQTASIDFASLQPNFAKGQCLWVSPELDLVSVATCMIRDQAERVRVWQEQGLLLGLSDDQAGEWLQDKQTVWALVITPWVLVQQAVDR